MEIKNVVGQYLQPGRSWYKRPISDIKHITTHHDAIPHDSKNALQVLSLIKNTHVNTKGWPGASYHFWISRTGNIYQLNNLTDITWHDSKNRDSVAICVSGYFHPPHNNMPTNEQLKAYYWLRDKLQSEHGWSNRGHRDVSSTACPGDNFYHLINKQTEKPMSEKHDVKGVGNVDVPTPKDQLLEIDEFLQEERKRLVKEKAKYSKCMSECSLLKLQLKSASTTNTGIRNQLNEAQKQLLIKEEEIQVLSDRIKTLKTQKPPKEVEDMTIWQFIKLKIEGA